MAASAVELDHLVVAVRDLDRAVREFRAAGFQVHDEGHQSRLPATSIQSLRSPGAVNAAVALDGASFLELIAFGSPVVGSAARLLARTPLWGPLLSTRSAAARTLGEGLTNGFGAVAVVLRVADLNAHVSAWRAAGFEVDEPVEVTRGEHRWRLAAAGDPTLPLLLEEITDRAGRVPALDSGLGPSIERIVVLSEDPQRTALAYRILLTSPGGAPTEATGTAQSAAPNRPTAAAPEPRWTIGDTRITVERGVPGSGVARLRVQLRANALPMSGHTWGLTVPADHPDPAIVERLAQALRLATVSRDDPAAIDPTPFEEFGQLLERSFPRVHATLHLEKFGHSRLYRWDGADPARVSALLLAHQDVVPADDPQSWAQPPFAGVVDDEFVWGRGSIDDKSRVLAILEAVESALADGTVPAGTVYLAFGHDEEVGGAHGAARIAARLRDLGVRPQLLLDEGGVVTAGLVEGVDRHVATIAVGEKGFATVRLAASGPRGHSSMPPKTTAVGRVARAVTRLQDNPLPARTTPLVIDMVRRVVPFMSEPLRTMLAPTARVAPVIVRIFSARPQTESLVRTTTAPTVIRGGVKANVLPADAEAFVNFRILQGESVADVVEHCRSVIADPEVTVSVLPEMRSEPSPLSPTDGPQFELVAGLTRALLPDVAVTTGLVPGATDSRHYDDIVGARINFAPIVLTRTDVDGIHGMDERISKLNYKRLIDFYKLLLREL